MKNKVSNLDCIEEEKEYASCQSCPYVEDYDLDDVCEDCNCFNNAFDMGFHQAYKLAREELMDDIYINGYKISQIDDIRHKVMALGNVIASDNVDKIDEILSDLTNLIKDTAMDAIDEYLGYR